MVKKKGRPPKKAEVVEPKKPEKHRPPVDPLGAPAFLEMRQKADKKSLFQRFFSFLKFWSWQMIFHRSSHS